MDYYSEIKKLPSEIKDILLSSYGASLNAEIAKKYNLDAKQEGQFIDFICDLFLRIFKIDNLESKIITDLKLLPDKAHSLALDMAGLKLLLADDYFKGEILTYLSKNNGDLLSYGQKVIEEKVALENERKFYAEDIEKPLESAIRKKDEVKKESKYIDLDDPVNGLAYEEDEKKSAISLFKEDLLDTLNLPIDFKEIIEEYNESLIDLLRDINFKKDLENALYSNQEKISANKISLDNREVEATVANYLRDFIKTNGSEFFSGVVLAQYLSSSANLKKLNQKEKYLVGQLLKLYRNLSFLPDSMGSLAVENWQIIPFDQVIINKSSVKNKPSKPEVSKKINSPSVAKEDLLNTPAELRELEKEILDYPENSLEYRALKEEMKRFSGAKKK